jgi:hypothetical protein
MKTVLGLILLAILSSSCMVTQECHTYDGSKRHEPSLAGARKSKPPKDRTPFYKVFKFAEK